MEIGDAAANLLVEAPPSARQVRNGDGSLLRFALVIPASCLNTKLNSPSALIDWLLDFDFVSLSAVTLGDGVRLPAVAALPAETWSSCHHLVAVISAQSQAQAALKHALHDRCKLNSQLPQPLLFHHSVSPYVSRRKSHTGASAPRHPHGGHKLFFSTPQLMPRRSIAVEIERFSSLFWGFSDRNPIFLSQQCVQMQGINIYHSTLSY